MKSCKHEGDNNDFDWGRSSKDNDFDWGRNSNSKEQGNNSDEGINKEIKDSSNLAYKLLIKQNEHKIEIIQNNINKLSPTSDLAKYFHEKITNLLQENEELSSKLL